MADKKISQLTAATTPLAGTEVLPIVQGGSTVKVSVDNLTAGKAVSASALTLTGGTANAVAYLNGSKAVTTGGVLLFDGSNLGIGSTPGYKLDVVQAGGTQNIFRAGQSGVSNGLTISSNGTNLTYQIDTGNLVVGTAGKGIDFSANTGNVLTQYKTASHTPTWTATSVNPALGNGTLIGSYVQIGSNCMFQFSLTMGSTTTFGTGEWEFTAPFTASKTGVGSVWALDSGTAYYIGAAKIEATSNKIYIWTNAGVTGWSATAPFTWAADDRIEVGISFTV